MRPLWSGTISFGLINIPIKLFSATEERGLNLDMLHKDDLCPIEFKRVCRSTGEEVPYNEIVKGYEYEEGDYVVLEKKDLQKAYARKTSTINIVRFVEESEIPSKFFEKPYYLEPAKGGDKAYVLLNEALKSSKKVALVKYVFRSKEDLGVIKADGDLLLLNQLRYFNEIRSGKGIKLPEAVTATKPEVEMAVKLVDQLTGHFNPYEFHDTFTEELKEVIEEKAHGKVPQQHEELPQPTPTADLMAQLRASLEQSKSSHQLQS